MIVLCIIPFFSFQILITEPLEKWRQRILKIRIKDGIKEKRKITHGYTNTNLYNWTGIWNEHSVTQRMHACFCLFSPYHSPVLTASPFVSFYHIPFFSASPSSCFLSFSHFGLPLPLSFSHLFSFLHSVVINMYSLSSQCHISNWWPISLSFWTERTSLRKEVIG